MKNNKHKLVCNKYEQDIKVGGASTYFILILFYSYLTPTESD